MSVTGRAYEPIHLITITGPAAETIRLNTSGGVIIHGGNTFLREDAQGGMVIGLGQVAETPDSFPTRDLEVTVTDWLRGHILSGAVRRISAVIQEASRDPATGVLTVYPITWAGRVDKFSWPGSMAKPASLVLVPRQVLDRLPLAHSTLSPASADKLSPGDRAFDMTGARITPPTSDAPISPGAPGGGGIYSPAPSEWRPPPGNLTDALGWT